METARWLTTHARGGSNQTDIGALALARFALNGAVLETSVFRYLKRWFDDGDAESPLDFNYVQKMSFLLSYIGSWPHKHFGRPRLGLVMSVYNLLLIVVAISLTSLGGTYIWYKRENISFFEIGHVLLCMFLEFLFLQRLFTAWTDRYRQTVKTYILEFHLFYFKNRSPYATKIYKQMQIVSRIFTIITICIILCGISLFNFMPWYNNYSIGMFGPDRPPNKTFEHAVYYHCFTEDVYTTLNGYWILFILNIPIAFHTTCGVMAFDLLLCLIVLQILGHLKIMKHSLLSITPKADMYSTCENMRVRETLKDIVVHHNIIIKFVNKCSDTFSDYLFAFYLLMQILSIISTLEITVFTAEALVKYGPLTFTIYQQLILVSILFEMINSRSTELIDAIYDIPWECMDTRNRRTAMILLMRAQTPLTLKAAKMVPVGVRTMSAVLKTTATYYMALNAVATERQMDQR
ncbi:uncharacterized protein LOC134660700 [Cydia amplana]|uniref:uncharacterized protein LOC134660700 n=1 Tax=Cydia amplana TaxID=1869771 RepID=UPI002FE62A73